MIRFRKHDPPAPDPTEAPATVRRSARSVRLQAHAPRLAFYGVVAILAVAGLRAALGPDPQPAAARQVADTPASDLGALSFAEGFARTYLTWAPEETEARRQRLAPFLPGSADAGAGLDPADGDEQTVEWTAVVGADHDLGRTLVTVAAQTSDGLTYLSVPVDRDRRGFLYVAGNPAVVGPPATNDDAPVDTADAVGDAQLEAVVERTLTNYLARADSNLRADLTADAVVSLPVEPLKVTDVGAVTWLRQRRRLAAEIDVEDERGTTSALRYELEVRKRERWFVQSLQVNPTFEGGS